MARIELTNMQFYANHGCFSQEQVIGTHFRVDMWFDTDTCRAEVSDNIDDTVSYLDVYQVVKNEMAKPSHLLEHVGRRICDAVMAQFARIKTMTVKVSKLNPPLGGKLDAVSVELSACR
ncbi:MAG: dihydroneopterin aldolase [Bacteroidales bacterium]|nr:dihydroneopterin aldolase [Bacteroidales bacterium]